MEPVPLRAAGLSAERRRSDAEHRSLELASRAVGIPGPPGRVAGGERSSRAWCQRARRDAGAAGPGAPGRGACCAFIISIVPLNFGAAAPFRLNPHFLQVVADSSF